MLGPSLCAVKHGPPLSAAPAAAIQPTPLPGDSADVSPQSHTVPGGRVTALGTILPAQQLKLSFATSGPVLAVDVQVGAEVQAGDRIAALDTTDLEMSVRDNLLTGAYLRRDKESVERDLQRVYRYFPVLGSAMNKPASKMSGGEQQMIAIGRGLMGSPRLLLLDEPSLGLSPILTREVGVIIKRIADEGMTILLIEQNANLALQLAHQCYVLETGSITLEGTSKELQDNEHVRAAYLGISCTFGVSSPVRPDTRVKAEGVPAEQRHRREERRRLDNGTPPPPSEHRLPESSAAGSRTSDLLGQEFKRPEKFRFDRQLPETSILGNSVYGISAPDKSILDVSRPPETGKEKLTVSNRVAGNERGTRVVKKVFTPKKG